jgi:hypothetical protein
MTERKWTKARVQRAYAEWEALNRHAEHVAAAIARIGGTTSDFWRLEEPNYGGRLDEQIEFVTWANQDRPDRFPTEYLWTDGWMATLQAEQDEWRASTEGRAREQEERETYQRLRAKFEPVTP